MPIDDLRTRPRPVATEVRDDTPLTDDTADDDDFYDLHDEHGGELNPTPERRAEIEAAWLAEALEGLKAIDEGRETAIPWEEARAWIFAPATPEELAAMQRRRARRR